MDVCRSFSVLKWEADKFHSPFTIYHSPIIRGVIMPERREAVIISAVRTPTGKFLGALKGFTATQLGALVVRESVRRAGVRPEDVDEVIMGCVVQAGLGQNPARQAALHGGIPFGVSAGTGEKGWGAGLEALMMGGQGG